MSTLAHIKTVSGELIAVLPEWTRITDVSQLQIGAEYYITWYSNGWQRFKNTIAEFTGEVHADGLVGFEHSDIPLGTLDEVYVYVAPQNPNKERLIVAKSQRK